MNRVVAKRNRFQIALKLRNKIRTISIYAEGHKYYVYLSYVSEEIVTNITLFSVFRYKACVMDL